MNNIITWLSALLTPTVAVVGMILAYLNYRLARRRRRDELFGCRYKFYEQVKSAWLATREGPDLDGEDLVPMVEEAQFLFGKDIADHVASLSGKRHSGSPFFADEDFVEPFRKYLTLSSHE